MLTLDTVRLFAPLSAAFAFAFSAHASVIVESSRRTTWALAGTTDDGGGIDTDTSTALGPLGLTSSMGPTDFFFVESSVSLVSSSTASGIQRNDQSRATRVG
jgi:hypothetical protein